MVVFIIIFSIWMVGIFFFVFNIMMDVGFMNREIFFYILKGLVFKGFFYKLIKIVVI